MNASFSDASLHERLQDMRRAASGTIAAENLDHSIDFDHALLQRYAPHIDAFAWLPNKHNSHLCPLTREYQDYLSVIERAYPNSRPYLLTPEELALSTWKDVWRLARERPS